MTDETTPVEPAQSEEELIRLRQVLEETKDRYLRAVAELDNQKKRAQREREEYIRFANESLLRELLPVLDNFDRALAAARAGSEAQGRSEEHTSNSSHIQKSRMPSSA